MKQHTIKRAAVCEDHKQHPDHSKQIHRINRIQGQLDGVKKMIEEKRYCPDIITQTRAITSAIRSLEATILESHLQSCVRSAFEQGSEKNTQAKIDELIHLFKKNL